MLNERRLQGGWIRHSVSADEDVQQRLAHANDIVGKILYNKKRCIRIHVDMGMQAHKHIFSILNLLVSFFSMSSIVD